jgi:hypothetical protein
VINKPTHWSENEERTLIKESLRNIRQAVKKSTKATPTATRTVDLKRRANTSSTQAPVLDDFGNVVEMQELAERKAMRAKS